MKQLNRIWLVLVLAGFALGQSAIAQSSVIREFRLIEIDQFGKEKPLDQKAGENLSVSGLHSSYISNDTEGLLTIAIPEKLYASHHIKLQFMPDDFGYEFFDNMDGTVELPEPRSLVIDVKFAKKKNDPFFQNSALRSSNDALRGINNEVNAEIGKKEKAVKDFASLPLAEQTKNEQLFEDGLYNDYIKDPRLKPYAGKIRLFIKYKALIRAWLQIDDDFGALKKLNSHHAFFEAKFLTNNISGIQLLIDSLDLALGNKDYDLGPRERSNLADLRDFLKNPEKTVDSGRYPDLKLFYVTAGNYVSGRTRLKTYLDTGYRSTFGKDTITRFNALNLSEGLAGFLIGRSQQKQSTIVKMGEFVQRNQDAETFFPATFRLMHDLTETSVPTTYTSFRHAFAADLAQFPYQVSDWIDTFKNNRPNASAEALKYIAGIYNKYLRHEKVLPGGIISADTTDLLSLMVHNLQELSSKAYLDPDDFENLGASGKKYFTVLLYRQQQPMFRLLDTINQFAHASAPGERVIPLSHDYYRFSEKVADLLAFLKSPPPLRITGQDTVAARVQAMNETYLKFYDIFYFDNLMSKGEVRGADLVSSNIFEFFEVGASKTPFVGAAHITEIINKSLSVYFGALKKGKNAREIALIKNRIGSIANSYLLFLQLSHARTPADVEQLMGRIEVPEGKGIINHHSIATLAVESYAGATFSKQTFGPALPLGINWALPLNNKNRAVADSDAEAAPQTALPPVAPELKSAIAFYLQVLDFANPFSYTFDTGPGHKTFAREEWNAVLAPGGGIGYEFKNYPLALLAAVIYNISSEGKRMFIPQLSLSFDLPLHLLYRKFD